jgi:hypothetical protein
VSRAFVRHDVRLFRDTGLNDRNDLFFLCAVDMEAADLACIAVDKREDGILMGITGLCFGLPALRPMKVSSISVLERALDACRHAR